MPCSRARSAGRRFAIDLRLYRGAVLVDAAELSIELSMLRLRRMSQDIRKFLTPSCDLLALGEPTHLEPAFGRIRNELFGQLAEHGFRSIALETDRVAALAVNDFVQDGVGTCDAVMTEGFS